MRHPHFSAIRNGAPIDACFSKAYCKDNFRVGFCLKMESI